MTYILIDPLIIMTPPDDASRDDVDIWFANLYAWLKEALTAPFTWLHYLQASHLLRQHGKFPDFNQLKILQRKHRLDVNISQIDRYINNFFRNENPDFATHIDSLEFIVETETASIQIQPTEFIARTPDYIRENLTILLAHCCVSKHMSLPFGQKLHIATLALLDNIRTITITTLIQATEPESICNDGETIIQTFPLLITPDDLPAVNDIVDQWHQGEESIIYIIQQLIRKETAITIKPFEFRLGPRFLQSVKECRLNTNEIFLRNIIRAAVNILLDRAKDINGYSLHELRINSASDSPQRERSSDDGQAWRLKLQQNGAGWRLHYWQIPTPEGSFIEFANICKESDSHIY